MKRGATAVARFEISSTVAASPEAAWQWITSVEGISAELRPCLHMGVPRGVRSLADLQIVPGQRLFRSVIYLLGVIPVDYSDLTLLEWTPGAGFVEQSPMGSMRSWRHERRIQPWGQGCRVTDRLAFEPRFAGGLLSWFVRRLFAHRHAVLRARLGVAPPM